MIKSLSILIPAYNVHQTIESVIKKTVVLGRSMTKKLEIIVVDDGSTDQTSQLLQTLRKKIPELRIITHVKNQGYGISIKDLYYAGNHEWLLTLPGDDQIEPDEAKKLFTMKEHADMILGKREKRGDHVLRRIQSKSYNALLKILFNISTTDVNTIRLMKQDIMKHIHLNMNSAFVDAELVLKTEKHGYTIVEVPILHKARTTPGATGGKIFATIVPTIIDAIYFFLHV